MIKQILKKYNLYLDANKDQFFLDNDFFLEKEVEEAEIGAEDFVLEIGAGVGTLTRKLAEKAKKVHAIENDSKVILALKRELDDLNNVEIIEADALEIDFPEFDKCVSNIPYSISSEVIEKLTEYKKTSVITLQKEFAERLVAEPGSKDYSRITILARFYFLPVLLTEIPRRDFFPRPRVDSSLVKLYPRENEFGVEDEKFFFKAVRALFMHKRKKIRNSFYDSRHIFEIDKEEAKGMRDKLPNSESRVFKLNIENLTEISKFLKANL